MIIYLWPEAAGNIGSGTCVELSCVLATPINWGARVREREGKRGR